MPLVKLSSGKSFEVLNDAPILQAALNFGITIPYSCKSGRCSVCKCKVVAGETRALVPETGLSNEEIGNGWILSCVRTASTDLSLDAEDLGESLPPVRTQPCRISRLEKLAPNVLKVVLRTPPNAPCNFIPGQYIEVIGPAGIRRSYSLAAPPSANNTLELHIREVVGGFMSQYWFNEAATGDLLRLRGPQGTFFLRHVARQDLIFLATGTGIAPIKAILEMLPHYEPDQQPKSVTVLWGGRYEHDLYFDVSSLPSALHYLPVLSRPTDTWRGYRGYVQDALLQLKPDLQNATVYACGSDAMIQSAKVALSAAGLPDQSFYSDAFLPSGIFEL
jgi:CDP-4-dehydro-6-deoxyglucose reductase